MDRAEYQNALEKALNSSAFWLEKTDFPKFKDEFRTFHTAFASLYKMLIQKKLINEDPYKHEAKMGEIKVPKPIHSEGDRKDQLTMNLSAYDNQLDFLVNFFQFSIDFLSLDNIKRILALVRYIDWSNFTADTQSSTTKVVYDLINTAKTGLEPFSVNVINEAISKLKQSTANIMGHLKMATAFNKESYKLEIRQSITGNMNDVTVEAVKKKFPGAMPKKAFYPDMVEELIKEDYSPGGDQLRNAILKQLAVPEEKPKVVKKKIDFKITLLDGLLVISSVGVALGDIAPKMDENHLLIQNRKLTFGEKLKEVFRQMFNKEPDPVIYEIEYIDPVKGVAVKEKVNFNIFRNDLDKRVRMYASFNIRNSAKAEAMDQKQLVGILEKAVRDAQSLHKTLTGLDEFFKADVPRESREKVKGIKPELATIKNAIVKANQKRHEYSAQLEEEEQLKRLGVNPVSQ
ncbi:MAG: hypothetical protein FWG29_05830 [Treponema sp.]|nr:hypothetical protein [Treponema sp.]